MLSTLNPHDTAKQCYSVASYLTQNGVEKFAKFDLIGLENVIAAVQDLSESTESQ